MEIDPVCGMKVDPEKTKYKILYRGRIYYFCSRHCLKKFEENPELYLREGPLEKM